LGEELDKYLIKDVWYIVPGFIVMFPLYLILKQFNSGFFGSLNFVSVLGFTLVSFISGYFCHQIYRLFYHIFLLKKRDLIKALKKKLYSEIKTTYVFFPQKWSD